MGNTLGSERTLCLPDTPFSLSMVAISLIEIAFLLPLLFFSLRASLKAKSSRLFKIIYWLTCFNLLVAGVFFPMELVFEHTFSGSCEDLTRLYMACIPCAAYFFVLVCISILYLVRFIQLFKISTSMLIILWFCIVCEFTLSLIMVVINYVGTNRMISGMEWETLDGIGYDIYLAFNIFNLFVNLLLLFLFTWKVLTLNKNIMETNEFQNAKIKINLMHPVVVYMICLSLAVMSTLMVTFFGFTQSNLYVATNHSFSAHLALLSWDVFINCLSLNLQFRSSGKLFAVCCGCCYDHLMAMFIRNTIVNKNKPLTYKAIQLMIDDKLHRKQPDRKQPDITSTSATTGNTTIGSSATADTSIITKYNQDTVQEIAS